MKVRITMKRQKKLPENLFVYYDAEGDYLFAEKTIDGIDNGTVVGIYKLEATNRVEVTRKLV